MGFWTKTIYFIIITLMFFILLSAYLIYERREEGLEKFGQTTECMITRVGHDNIYIEYEVDGMKYSGSAVKPFPNIYVGEKYKIMYNREEPDETKFYASEPVIDLGVYDTVLTYDVKKDWLIDDLLKFSYNVDGKEFERLQYYDSSLRNYDLNIPYAVIYRKRNHQIGYLLLNFNENGH